MFRNINLKEAAIMAQVITTDRIDEDGKHIKARSLEECLAEMELIDDLLGIMKSKSLLNKKRGLKKTISARIDLELADSQITPGSSNLHFTI